MKLFKKTHQYRRDFSGIYECENCGHKEEYKSCYDDDNFHQNVTPNWKCTKCNKSTIDLGLKPIKIATRYRPWEVV